MHCRLAWKLIKMNKRLTVYMVVALLIAGSLITVGGNLMNAYGAMRIANLEQRHGRWHLKLRNEVMEEPAQFFSEYSEQIGQTGRELYLYSTDYQGPDDDAWVMDIVAGDKDYYDLSCLNVFKGRLPENEREIVFDYKYLINGKTVISQYNLGDTITLQVGRRMDDERVIYGDTAAGSIVDTESVSYTIVGFAHSEILESHAITSYTYKQQIDAADRYIIRLTDSGIESVDSIVSALGLGMTQIYNTESNGKNGYFLNEAECPASMNGVLLSANYNHGFIGGDITTRVWFYAVAILIVLAGFLMVFNIYRLVLSKRTKEYATFRALGMSDNGIFLICLIEGILIWMLAGLMSILAAYILNMGMVVLLRQRVFQSLKHIQLEMSWRMIAVGCIATLAMMLATVFLDYSSRKHLTVQQLITGHGENQKVYKGRGSILKLPIELRLSIQYILKGKMKFLCMVLSFAVSILLIYGFYCAERESRVSELADGIYQMTDFYAWGQDVRDISELLSRIPYAESASEAYVCGILIPKEELPFTEEFRQDTSYTMYFESEEAYIDVSFFSEKAYDRYIRPSLEEDMTYEEWVKLDQGFLSDWYRGSDNKMHKMFEKREELVLNYEGREDMLTPYEAGSITCRSCMTVNEMEENNYLMGSCDIFLYFPMEKMQDLFDASTYQFIYIDAEKGHEYDLLEWLTDNRDIYNYTLQDNITKKVYQENLRIIVLIVMSFVCGLLLLVSIVNIWNTTQANIYDRSYELTVLKELGMSNYQKFFVCMPDLVIALLIAFLFANVMIRFFIGRYFDSVEGIPIWISILVLGTYMLLIMAAAIPNIYKLDDKAVSEG